MDGWNRLISRSNNYKLMKFKKLLGKDPRRQNVVVTANIDILVNASSPLASKSEPIGLMLFVGHMDTVAVGDVIP